MLLQLDIIDILDLFTESGDPLVSQEMATISASRAVAVESACKYLQYLLITLVTHAFLDAATEFCPQNITQSLQQINHRLGVMDNRLGVMDNHLGNINNRLGNIDNLLGNVNNRLGIVEDNVRDITDDVRAVRAQAVNVRIISRNKLYGAHALEALQKTVGVAHQSSSGF